MPPSAYRIHSLLPFWYVSTCARNATRCSYASHPLPLRCRVRWMPAANGWDFLGGYSEISLSRNVILKFLVFFLVSEKRVDRDSLGFTRKLSSLLEFEWNSSIQDSSFSKNRGIWIFNSTLITCIIDIIYYILDRNIDRIKRNKTFSLNIFV